MCHSSAKIIISLVVLVTDESAQVQLPFHNGQPGESSYHKALLPNSKLTVKENLLYLIFMKTQIT